MKSDRVIELLEIIAREVEGLGENLETIKHAVDYISNRMVDEDQVSDIRDEIDNIQHELELRRPADKVPSP